MNVLKLAALVALAWVLCAPVIRAQDSGQTAPQGESTHNYAENDRVMNAAISEARATFGRFLHDFNVASPDERAQNFLVKVGLDARGGGVRVEHIWVNHLSLEDGHLFGELANDPEHLPGLVYGSRVEVDTARVSDWAIMTEDGMYGNFTTRVMLDDLPSDEAAEVQAVLAPSPLPPSWSH